MESPASEAPEDDTPGSSGEEARERQPRWLWPLAAAIAFATLGLAAWRDTMSQPTAHELTVALPGVPAGSPPFKIALLSDVHGAWPGMTPARIARIVAKVNGARPDAIVLAGDFVAERAPGIEPGSMADIAAELGRLRAPTGVYAVIGNHDLAPTADAVSAALSSQGIAVLRNRALRAGPVSFGGLDGQLFVRGRVEGVMARMAELGGGQIVIGHAPDDFALLRMHGILMLAGHTHCGQLALFGWVPYASSRLGRRFACGIIREHGSLLIVTSGLGTSRLGLRLGAPPDFWLVTVVPRQSPALSRGASATLRNY